METIKITEQQIINAICMYIADKRGVSPSEVLVEIMYDDDYGYSAEIEVNGRQQILIELNLIEALRQWIHTIHQIDPFSVGLQLELDEEEGILAFART